MSTHLIMKETDERPALLRVTCWAVWLIVVPVILLSLLILADVPVFQGVTNLTIGLPLPIGLIPLLLVVLSTVGIWQRQAWGVLLFGASGLLGVAVMLLHPDAIPVLADQGLPDTLAWLGIGAVQLYYTWQLWTRASTTRS